MPPKKTPAPTTTPAPEPETAEQSAIASPEPGTLEIRFIPGRGDIEVWISNRKVYGNDAVQGAFGEIGRLLERYKMHDRMPNHVTIISALVDGLPAEEEWTEWDARQRARAQAANAPPPETAEAPAPAGQEDESDGE